MKALKAFVLFVLISILSVFFSCSGSKAVFTKNGPDWINKGSGFFDGEKGKAFYGIGVSNNVDNIMLRRNAADAQARADLSRVFSTSIQDLVKIYARSVSGGAENRVSEEQLVQQTTKAFTEIELSGSMVIDRYYDPAARAEYSLVILDMKMFMEQIDKMEELSKRVKEVIEKNAEKAFDELAKMSKKGN